MRAEFWLDDVRCFFILHAARAAGEEGMEVFPGLWLDA
jgi:hypothetical protein